MGNKTDELIDEMCERRYRNFREAHGMADEDPFVGDPRAECIEELVDALNYLEEVDKTGGNVYTIRALVRGALAACILRWLPVEVTS